MKPRPVQAVIFDCDGTLVDSLPLVAGVLCEYLTSLRIDVPIAEAAALFGSGRLADSVDALEGLLGRPLPAEFIPELLRRRDARCRERLRPVDGAVALVSSLRVPMAVASNGPLEQTMLSLEVTGLLPYFGANVFSAHEVGSWKPGPGLFLHAAQAMGIDPSRCAVVEDSALGIAAGLAAGMTVLALAEGEGWESEDVTVIERLSDVQRHLDAIAGLGNPPPTTFRTADRRSPPSRGR